MMDCSSLRVTKKLWPLAFGIPSKKSVISVTKAPTIFKKTGNEVLDIPDGHICCGSAGTYNILQQNIANTLLQNKVKNIAKVSPDFISTGNIGCMTQISNGTNIPIIHTVEVIDWLTGGPKPIKLKNL